MPTVFDENGFRGMVYTLDHEPAHVQVYSGDGYAIINVGHGKTEVRETKLSRADTAKAKELAIKHRAKILKEWRRIHGSR